MPQGDRRGGGVELYDYTYDGNVTEHGSLCGGLGQLVDGEEGQSNFRLDPLERGVRGYEWIGWKNDSFTAERPLELTFRLQWLSLINLGWLVVFNNEDMSVIWLFCQTNVHPSKCINCSFCCASLYCHHYRFLLHSSV